MCFTVFRKHSANAHVRVCNSACVNHQLVNCPTPPVWFRGNESDSIPDKRDGFAGRQQPIG